MFYKSIASVYDYIFPQNEKQLHFIEAIRNIDDHERILEVGCATGNLTELLSRKSQEVIGLDLDSELLEKARSKYPELDFRQGNMLHIKDIFHKAFTRIISFGNTLVHLSSLRDIESFCKQVYDLLEENGLFMVQIINYDRILNQNIDYLPTIENNHIQFIRKYEKQNEYLLFNTQLHIKEHHEIIENSIPLLALRQSDIENILVSLGFQDIQFYGSLMGNQLDDQSIPLLFSCRKGVQ